MTTVITDRGVRVYQAMVIRKAIDFYLAHGMQVNRAYTPKAMLATASAITGESYGPRWSASAAANAIKGLSAWIEAQHGEGG